MSKAEHQINQQAAHSGQDQIDEHSKAMRRADPTRRPSLPTAMEQCYAMAKREVPGKELYWWENETFVVVHTRWLNDPYVEIAHDKIEDVGEMHSYRGSFELYSVNGRIMIGEQTNR